MRREFDAEITEQHPDERVAWRSVEGPEHGAVGTRIKSDLERFKNFIEARGQETGGWRGDINRPPQAGEK